MSRRIWIPAAAGAVLAALAVTLWVVKKRTPAEDLRAVQATVGAVEETVETTGGVAPLNRVEISPPISGRIEKLLVDEGDNVRAGDVIAWMSSSDRAAVLDAARAKGPDEVKLWEESYKPTPIVSPLSGVVILRNVVVGQAVSSGSVVYAISDRLIVIADVDESDIGRVRVGMPVRITLDAYPDRITNGRVMSILHEGRNVSNVITYGVKIRLDDIPSYFRSQMSANIGLIVRREQAAVLVPESAVRPGRRGGMMVLVPGPKGRPVPQPVQTGIETEGRIQIVSGLDPGATVFIVPRRYSPQRGQQGSPLAPGGAPGGGGGGTRGGGGGGGRNR